MITHDVDYLNMLSRKVIGSAIDVHREVGPGLLESVYQRCMLEELARRELKVGCSVSMPITYKGKVIDKEYVIDLLVEDQIIIELKSVENILPVHEAQIISYLKLADKRLGLLINFNVPILKLGIKRFVNGI